LKKSRAFQQLLVKCENGCKSRIFEASFIVTSSDFRRFLVPISAKQVPKVAHCPPKSKPMFNEYIAGILLKKKRLSLLFLIDRGVNRFFEA